MLGSASEFLPQGNTVPSGSTSTVRLLTDVLEDPETVVAQANDREISQALWKQVFRYAYSLVGNHAEAEDIAQETFVALFQEERKNRAVEQVGGWMRTVARRVAYRQYHRTRPDLHLPLERIAVGGELVVVDPIDPTPSAEDRIIDDTLLRLGARVICSFSERERQCIMMYFRGYDFAQIGTKLNVSRWTARRVTLKALTQLQSKFKQPGR